MSSSETLTEEERRWLRGNRDTKPEGHKALRIIDAQAARIAELECEQSEERRLHCTARVERDAANALLQKCRRVLPKMGRDADYIGVDALVATIDAHLEATK